MFVLPVIAFVGGLVAMGRTKPETGVRKLICLGPRSGLVYPVEDFPEIGVVVVRAPGGRTIAQFLRAAVREPGKPGLVYQQGQGDRELLELIRQDFGLPPPKLAAVSDAQASGKVPGPSPEGFSEPKPETSGPKPFSRPSSKASTPSGI